MNETGDLATEDSESAQDAAGSQARYALLRQESVESVKEKYREIRRLSSTAEIIVNEIVAQYATDLDTYIASVDSMLDDIRDGRRSEFADADLQRIVLRLPIIMYRLGDGLDRAAIESDISKAVLQHVSAMNYLNAPGKTIPEKRSYAEIATADEASIVDLTRHVYQRLKNKLEKASDVFDGVRKVITMRDTQKQVFGRTK